MVAKAGGIVECKNLGAGRFEMREERERKIAGSAGVVGMSNPCPSSPKWTGVSICCDW